MHKTNVAIIIDNKMVILNKEVKTILIYWKNLLKTEIF